MRGKCLLSGKYLRRFCKLPCFPRKCQKIFNLRRSDEGRFAFIFVTFEWKIGVNTNWNMNSNDEGRRREASVLSRFMFQERIENKNNEKSLNAVICWLISSSFVICYRSACRLYISISCSEQGEKMIINKFTLWFLHPIIPRRPLIPILRHFARRWFSHLFLLRFLVQLKRQRGSVLKFDVGKTFPNISLLF